MADEIELSAAPVCQSAPPEAPFPQMMPTYGAGQIRDESVACYAPPPDSSKLDDILDDVDDTFQESLLKIIDEKGLKDTAVYKKADIDRRHFSKIRSHADYRPRKQTALALALALELNLDETIDLIGRAGYALSNSSRADLIVRYCIEHGIFKLVDVSSMISHFWEAGWHDAERVRFCRLRGDHSPSTFFYTCLNKKPKEGKYYEEKSDRTGDDLRSKRIHGRT